MAANAGPMPATIKDLLARVEPLAAEGNVSAAQGMIRTYALARVSARASAEGLKGFARAYEFLRERSPAVDEVVRLRDSAAVFSRAAAQHPLEARRELLEESARALREGIALAAARDPAGADECELRCELSKRYRFLVRTLADREDEPDDDEPAADNDLPAILVAAIRKYLVMADRECRWVAEHAMDPLWRVRALVEFAIVARLGARVRLYPQLEHVGKALELLDLAAAELEAMLWPGHARPPERFDRYKRLRVDSVTRALARLRHSPDRSEALRGEVQKLFSTLGACHLELGDLELAWWLYFFAREYGHALGGSRAVLSDLDLARVERDLNPSVAIARYEAALLVDPDEVTGHDRAAIYSRFISGTEILAKLLKRQGARAESRRWQSRRAELVARAAGSGLHIERREESRPKTFAGLRKNLLKARAQQAPGWIVRELRQLARRLRLVGLGRYEEEEAVEAIRKAVEVIDAWRPSGRGTSADREARPAAWLVDPLAEAAFCLRLALDFAGRYCPGLVAPLFVELGSYEEERARSGSGPDREGLRALWLEAAERAAALGQWQEASLAYFKAARLELALKLPSAGTSAARAGEHLAAGLSWFEVGEDKSDALRRYDPRVRAIAELLQAVGAPPPTVFSAIENCKGHTLQAARLAAYGRLGSTAEQATYRDLLLKSHTLALRVRREPELGAELDKARTQIASLEARLARDDGAVAPRRRHRIPRRFSQQHFENALRRLRSACGPIAVVEYFIGWSGVWAAVAKVDDAGTVMYRCPGEALAKRQWVAKRRKWLWHDLTDQSDGTDDWREDIASEMYEALVRPLEPFLRGARTICFIPHRSLASIPFHALRSGSGYLVERFDVGYAPSANLWRHVASVPRYPGGGLLALGWEADIRAREEAEMVAATLAGALGQRRTVPAVEDEGLSLFLDASHLYAVVHVVAHGEFDGKDPLASRLVFPRQDVAAERIYREGARAQLVFLNCCRVGLQEPRAGDLYGLPFALLGGGSLSAITPMVPVWPSPARAFAARFYKELVVDGTRKLHAFSETVRSFIRSSNPELRHPASWAPYFFIGDPTAMVWQVPAERRPASRRPVARR